MNSHDTEDAFDAALRQQLQGAAEPADAGFSLRVMTALPARMAPRKRSGPRWVRLAQWAAVSAAAVGVAALLSAGGEPVDGPRVLAAVALLGLLIFWSIPSRWSRG